jgi:23S rRNA (uracil1939-C5)-methyltransferase
MNTHPIPLKVGDLIKGGIQSIAFGGEGILRHQGFVIFIPFTVPGDQILCRVVEVKKSFAKGELLRIQEPSSQRVNPLCPYFGTCGGCQLQHMSYQEQLHYKLHAVLDALKRIGHVSLPKFDIVPAHMQWSYRRHVTLHLRPKQTGFQAGYIAVDNRSLVVVQTCPIFNEKEDPVLSELQEWVAQLSNPLGKEGKALVLKTSQNKYIISFDLPCLDTKSKQFIEARLPQSPCFEGVLVTTSDQEFSFGKLQTEYKLEGLTFQFTPQTFIQNHPEQSANIYRHLCRLTQPLRAKKILDLYCGFGISTLLLAQQGHEVLGIEYNDKSISLALQNTLLNDIKRASFKTGAVEKWLSRLEHQKFDLILLNPPRTGLSPQVLKSIAQMHPEEMIYISCMPTTLARDLAYLNQEGYTVEEGTVYDMFPQTGHVETLVYLKKKYNRSVPI